MSAKTGAGRKPEKEPYRRLVATNRRARHVYNIEETFEAGLELKGSEVKSLREGKADLSEGFAQVEGGELFLFQVNISPYQVSPFAPSPTRKRKLLVKRDELKRLAGRLSRKGMTLVPLRLYFNDRGWAKLELGVARGRKGPDRRDEMRKRSAEREMREARRI